MTSKSIEIVLYFTVVFFITACVSSSKISLNNFVYNGHNFGADKNSEYRLGIIDGCKTSGGEYSKNHIKFNKNIDYHNGWEDGRLNCK